MRPSGIEGGGGGRWEGATTMIALRNLPGTPRTSVAERARRYLAKCPPAISGQGGHNATYHAAAAMIHGFDLSEADTLALLRDWNRACQPPWSEAEMLHKVRSAANAPQSKPRGYLAGAASGKPRGAGSAPAGGRLAARRKPVFCPMVLKRVAAKMGAVPDVFAFVSGRSPVAVGGQDSAAVLRRLYPKGSGERVVIFSDMKSQGQMVWEADKGDRIEARQLPTGPDGVWFLAQPVDGEFHPNPRLGGKSSRRSEEAVTSWRYVVLESDEADADEWLRCLVQMPLRIACICESGGRSVHALVRVDAASKRDWDARVGSMKPGLITLGADAGALSAVRLTRLPQAMRGGRLQRLLYLNPTPDGKPIAEGSASAKGRE